MALNIQANEGVDAAPAQNEQKDQPMNNQNTGFGAPPQDQNQNQNNQYQDPNGNWQSGPNNQHQPDAVGDHNQAPPQNQGGGFGAPNQQPNYQPDPQPTHQSEPQPQNPPQNQGGGFANTFGGPNPGGNPPMNNGGFNGNPQNQGGGFNAPQNNQGHNQQPQSGGAVPANLMKTGADAYQAFQSAQQNQGGGDRRFFLKQGEERTVVFLDGDLDGNGFFTNPVTREHTVKIGNKFQNILCLNEQEPCPLCQLAGENSPVGRASFVCYFTVLDRTGYVDQQGNRHSDFVAIYVAKTNTLKQLQAFAKKLGGLRGQEMTITRTNSNNAPRVGDMFIPGQKWDIQNQIIPHFVSQGRKAEEFQPFDYAKAITYYSADQLRSMGFNDGHFSGSPAGFSGPGTMNQSPSHQQDQQPQGGGFGNQGGGFGNQGNPPNQGGFPNQQPNHNQGSGFPNQQPNQGGGFGGNPSPTPHTQDFSQDM